MSRIFISHSNRDAHWALVLRDWLVREGWIDVFLDLDPERGIAAGDRWMKALEDAVTHCEAVLFLVSEAWLASKWCHNEYRLANRLNKKLFALLIDDVALDRLPGGLTAQWQVVSLRGEPAERFIAVDPRTQQQLPVHIAQAGLQRLKLGLLKAGIAAETFALQPEASGPFGWRAVYRGLEALEPQDAAVFFGRNAELVRSMDALRGLAARKPPRLLVILGASGAGKSSFLRAGLWPRLARDDSQWLPLKVIRASRGGAIEGSEGLLAALEDVHARFGLRTTRAALRGAIATTDHFVALLEELRQAAARRARLDESLRPLPVLCLDQGEELFVADAGPESAKLLALARAAIEADAALLLVTIRSDAYGRMQVTQALAGIDQVALPLGPVPQGEIGRIIREPSEVLRRNAGPQAPVFDPAVVEQLQNEIAGEVDALPLLAFLLYHLMRENQGATTIGVRELVRTGGVAAVIERQAEAALVDAGYAPDRAGRRDVLRRLFIPRLARIDRETKALQPRVARWSELPADLAPLARALIERRLLVSRGASAAEYGGTADATLEVAHEALLRRWPTLADLLAEHRDVLLDPGHKVEGRWYLRSWIDRHRAALSATRSFATTALIIVAPLLVAIAAKQIIERGSVALRDPAAGARNDVGQSILDTLRHIPRAHQNAITSLAVTADGKFAITGAFDGAIKLWDLASGTRADWAERLATVLNRDLGNPLSVSGSRDVVQIITDQAQIVMEGREVRESRVSLISDIPDFIAQSRERPSLEAMLRSNAGSTAIVRNWFPGLDLKPFVALRLPGPPNAYAVGEPDGRVAIETSGERADQQRAIARMAEIDRREPPAGSAQHQGAVTALAVGAGGKLASVSDDGSVILWTLDNGSIVRGRTLGEEFQIEAEQVLAQGANATGAAFSPDGRRVLTSSRDAARLWNAQTGEPIAAPMTTRGIEIAMFSPDGARVLTAAAGGAARIWDAASGAPVGEELTGHAMAITSAAFSPDGRTILTGSQDESARLWDAATGRFLRRFAIADVVAQVAFDPAGMRAAIASESGSVGMWELSSGALRYALRGHRGAVLDIAFSPDGRRLVTAGVDASARVWDVAGGNAVAVLRGHRGAIVHARFSPDGKRVVTASSDGTARVWNSDGTESLALIGHTAEVVMAAFSPDGRSVLTASADLTARLWNAEWGAEVAVLRGHTDRITSVAWSRDGSRGVTASADGTARIWVLRGLGAEAQSCMPCTTVAFSADGKRLISAGGTGMAQIWNAENGAKVTTLGHRAPINVARLSADGALAITAADDGAARLWDAGTGNLLAVIRGHGEAISHAELTPDGARLVTASRDGMVRVTSLAHARWLDVVDVTSLYRRYIVPWMP